MIGDVINKAIKEIERYEAEYPGAYGDSVVAAKILRVKVAMRELERDLDAWPEADGTEPINKIGKA